VDLQEAQGYLPELPAKDGMTLLNDVRRGVQTGNLSINEARMIIWDHEFDTSHDPMQTWMSVAFLAALACLLVIVFGLELLLAWR
jgi:hypothetical protein